MLDELVAEANSWIKQICTDTGVYYADLASILNGSDGYISDEFVTPDEREALATNITIALAAIRMPDAEVHLRVAHRTYPAAEWAMALNATSDEGPGWRDYLEEMYRHVWAKDFWTKEVYLGVRLGARGKQLGAGALAQLLGFYQRTEKALGIEDDVTSMLPGACVMQKGGRISAITACGVTPHAQNTGSSSSFTSTGTP